MLKYCNLHVFNIYDKTSLGEGRGETGRDVENGIEFIKIICSLILIC